jgi:hypothetical protein
LTESQGKEVRNMPVKKKKTTKTTSKATKKGKKGGMSRMMIGAAGAVVGAAIGGAAATALASDRNRKKLGSAVENFGEYATDAVEAVNENAHTVAGTANQTASGSGKPKKTTPKK